MKIFIKQFSEFEYIKYPIDDIIKKYDLSDIDIQNAIATFSLYDKINRTYIIANKSAEIIAEPLKVNLTDDYKYFLQFRLNKTHTQVVSTYFAEFKLDLIDKCATLTVPNFDYINVYITKSITRTDVVRE